MGLIEKNLICEEMKKSQLCRWYWSEAIEKELEKDIHLEREPVVDMSIYKKSFVFHTSYLGNEALLQGTKAVIKLDITSCQSSYDIQKAINGTDFFHNVQIVIRNDEHELVSEKHLLWSDNEAYYCGNERILALIFGK